MKNMHKLSKKFLIGSSILLLVLIVTQNIEVGTLSSVRDTIFKEAIGFEQYKEGENEVYPINHNDSLSVLRHSVGVQASIQSVKDADQISKANMQILEEVHQEDVKRESIKVQRAINLRMKELLDQLVVRPKQN